MFMLEKPNQAPVTLSTTTLPPKKKREREKKKANVIQT